MKIRDPLGVEIKVGRKVVCLVSHAGGEYMRIGTVKKVEEGGTVTVTGLAGERKGIVTLEFT